METVPRKWCNKPTPMTGTKQCNACWELSSRIEWDPEIAKRIIKSLESDSSARYFEATLPFAPTINHMYGSNKNRRFIKPEGVLFFKTVKEIVGDNFRTLKPPYKLIMRINMPDKRKRDGGNLLKATEDSLTKAGVIEDDKHFDKWDIEKLPEIIKGGKIFVRVEELN